MGDIQDLEKKEENKNNYELYELEQIRECLCRIENKNGKGVGFFCTIPFEKNNLNALITTNSIINEDILRNDKLIEIIIMNNDENQEQMKRIKIYDKRKVYTSIQYDITIIEIYPKNDNIHKYLKINENLFQNNMTYEKIFIIQYITDQKKIKKTKSPGIINQINDYNLKYTCNSSESLPGCPILDISSREVIGMHRESLLNFNNRGILLKKPLNKYINDILNKNCKNEINMKIRIEEKDINKEIYILYGNTNIVESYRSSGRFSSYCLPDSEKEINNLNSTNVELFINNIKYDYNNYFKAKKEGIYDVKLKFLSKIENCNKMFCGCKNITYIDLSFFDSSNIIDTSYMFNNCINLEAIDFSSFDTKNVTDMKYMFKGCNNLTNVNLSFFNTKNVKYMNHMFEGCSNLKDIYLSSFDTHNVTDMNCMFANCINLANLDLSSFETVNVTCMECMFYNCCSLVNINISNFDTINVTNADNLFGCCYNLSVINLNSFNRLFINKKLTQNCINLLL